METRDVSMETPDYGTKLLLEFVRTKIRDRRPRATTGKVRVDKQGHVMVVKRFEPLPAVLRKFAIEGFLSAPVQDSFGQYCGIITMLDLVKYTSDLFYGKDAKAWIDFWNKEDRFHQATVDDVMKSPNIWNRDPYPPLSNEFTRFHVLETMVRTGARAISVVDSDLRITGFETQSRLISFLRQKLDPLSSLAMMSVERILADTEQEVFTVKETDPAINAYNLMVQKNVTGLAIVNAEGLLVGAITTHDLRAVGFDGERFNRLFHSVKDFKAASTAEYPKLAPTTHFSVRSTPLRPLYVTPNNTLEDVVGLMNDGNIHRIFVCSQDSVDQGKPMPIDVVSQVDVLRCTLNFITEPVTWA